jgi:DNA-binding LacI/PurR family transcriptional regulator
MKASFPAAPFDAQSPVSRQIREHVRGLIHRGVFGPGARLPSYRVLARTLRVPPSTVNVALAPLVKEGLLMRQHGSGTFVQEGPRQLKTIGIYYYGPGLCAPEARFYRALQQRLEAQIGGAGRRWSVWTDPRSVAQEAAPWRELMDAARRREFDALLVPFTNVEHLSWLAKVPVPVAYVTSAPVSNRVHFDLPQFAKISIRALADQGCRSVGLIASLPLQTANPDGSRHEAVGFLDAFMEQAGGHGMRIRDAWMVTPQILAMSSFPSAERYGYEAFLRIWRRSPRPEGLVVITDAEAQGVAMAVAEQRVRVPGELRLVFHKNAEVDLLCPCPVTLAVSSADEVARGLIDLVEKQYAGEVVQPVVVQFALQKAERQQ